MDEVPLLEAEHISRDYGTLAAVRDVSFTLARGEVLGFLGPNGAGKSTTMQVVTGNLAPSAGRIRIGGIDLLEHPRRAKAQLGYLPEQPPLYRELTVDEYLGFCARLNRLARGAAPEAVARAKGRCGLEEVGRRPIGNLSKGFQQRVGIAQAILHNPAVVILDEPTVGLDPIQIREIRTLIRELAREHGIILSTHILPEVQATCDRVQIIHRGRLVYSERLDALNRQADSGHLLVAFAAAPPQEALLEFACVQAVAPLEDGRLRLQVSDAAAAADDLARAAVENGWGLRELIPERRTLEQVFVALTAGEAEAA